MVLDAFFSWLVLCRCSSYAYRYILFDMPTAITINWGADVDTHNYNTNQQSTGGGESNYTTILAITPRRKLRLPHPPVDVFWAWQVEMMMTMTTTMTMTLDSRRRIGWFPHLPSPAGGRRKGHGGSCQCTCHPPSTCGNRGPRPPSNAILGLANNVKGRGWSGVIKPDVKCMWWAVLLGERGQCGTRWWPSVKLR